MDHSAGTYLLDRDGKLRGKCCLMAVVQRPSPICPCCNGLIKRAGF